MLLGTHTTKKTVLGNCFQAMSCTNIGFVSLGTDITTTVSVIDADTNDCWRMTKIMYNEKTEQPDIFPIHEHTKAKQNLERRSKNQERLVEAFKVLNANCYNQQRNEDLDHVLARTKPTIMIIDCVEEIEDAYMLMEALEEAKIKLLQVLYIPNNVVANKLSELELKARRSQNNDNWLNMSALPSHTITKIQMDNAKLKWESHAAKLIEFFSSMGVLSEIGMKPGQLESTRRNYTRIPGFQNLKTLDTLELMQDQQRPGWRNWGYPCQLSCQSHPCNGWCLPGF